MPRCQQCRKEWSWKKAFARLFVLRRKMTCPYCGKKQYATAKSRKQMTGLSMMLPLIPLLQFFTGHAPGWIPLLLAGSGVFLLGLFPFLLKLSNEEEPLW